MEEVGRRPAGGLDRVGPVGGVESLELTVLNHRVEDAGVEKLGLLDNPVDHLLARLLQLGLDKADHGHVALDFDVLPEIQAVGRCTEGFQTYLLLLWRLDSWLVTGNAILVPQVDVHGRVDVCL